MTLQTSRLRLRRWRDADRPAFAAMNTDAEVMRDLGGPIGTDESDAKFDRYAAAWQMHGVGRWLIETPDGGFAGYAGILPSAADHPLGPHFEIGWRLVRSAWGHGYASEAARAALADGFERLGLAEVLAYTAPDNARSQAVMTRLGLRRDAARDFELRGPRGSWRGLVWAARP
ncbi:MAG: GNAT family N-acetyltransferase [Rhizomicrobium sp.]